MIEFATLLGQAAKRIWPELKLSFELRPLMDYSLGDLSSDICKRASAQLRRPPDRLATEMIELLQGTGGAQISNFDGFINIRLPLHDALSRELYHQHTPLPDSIVIAADEALSEWGLFRLKASAALQHAMISALGGEASSQLLHLGKDDVSIGEGHKSGDFTLWAPHRLWNLFKFRPLNTPYRSKNWLSPISDFEKELSLASILYAAHPRESELCDPALSLLHVVENLPWYLEATLGRIGRNLGAGSFEIKEENLLTPVERKVLVRLSQLPAFERLAAAEGAIFGWILVLEEILGALNAYFNQPALRKALREGTATETQLFVLSRAVKELREIQGRFALYRGVQDAI